jgi:protein involved in polysaccharide export with SLBB domain
LLSTLWKQIAILVLLAAMCCLAAAAFAQLEPGEKDYRYRAGDTVYLSVPMRPSLNGDLVIDESGAVVLPLIGRVDVAGLTLEEMHAKIYQALRDLYPSLRDTDVDLEPSLGYVVYVTGAVNKPGRYAFSGPPRVWDAIRRAEGPTGEAALDMVRIVDAESDSSLSRVVNVLRALETGTVERLPRLGK